MEPEKPKRFVSGSVMWPMLICMISIWPAEYLTKQMTQPREAIIVLGLCVLTIMFAVRIWFWLWQNRDQL